MTSTTAATPADASADLRPSYPPNAILDAFWTAVGDDQDICGDAGRWMFQTARLWAEWEVSPTPDLTEFGFTSDLGTPVPRADSETTGNDREYYQARDAITSYMTSRGAEVHSQEGEIRWTSPDAPGGLIALEAKAMITDATRYLFMLYTEGAR